MSKSRWSSIGNSSLTKMDLLINPPTLDTCGQQTVDLYQKEITSISDDLKEKAMMIYKKLNTMKYFKCNEIEGAMYAFPSIELPDDIISKAKESNLHPDYYYCLKLLESTGLVTVPGSGFGQKEGTYHLRVTNLICPKEELIKQLDKIEQFNNSFFN
jgi:alanine transaminase